MKYKSKQFTVPWLQVRYYMQVYSLVRLWLKSQQKGKWKLMEDLH